MQVGLRGQASEAQEWSPTVIKGVPSWVGGSLGSSRSCSPNGLASSGLGG